MEDRCEHGLYFEMFDAPVTAYLDERIKAVARLPGVRRATCWRNVHRDRSDLPRTLAEFDFLAVYEVDERFAAPNLDTDVRALQFVRTGRPGQGTLRGRETIGLSVVLISPRDDNAEQSLRDWADFVHIRHIAAAAVPGYTMITPYINARPGDHPRFLHLYEMDCEDPERAFKAMTPMVTDRIGPRGSPEWSEWAFHPSLRIDYVNTFERLGVFE